MSNAPRTFQVPDVSCDHCERAITGAVGELGGVAEVRVDIDRKLVTVAGDAPDDAIVAAIEDAGYDVAGQR